jgi:Uncharacterized protein conserved in bacteria (DUF2252)
MNIQAATAGYEAWMARHLKIVKRDLRFKHAQMSASPFMFFRATFYRWLELYKKVTPEAARAPKLLAVGDLHVENFGTWRDCEGRLIWGINDFDEAFFMPYTIDLVRLVASARLATETEHLAIRPRDASDAVLEGYSDSMRGGGRPIVLGEEHRWLRLIALSRLRDPVHFWAKMQTFRKARGHVPGATRRELKNLLPAHHLLYSERQRVAGLGSLGHQRLVMIAEWGGGLIAREAKALTPSACVWAHGSDASECRYDDIIRRAVRVPDPFVRPVGTWLLRRLAPDCSRIELATLPESRDEEKLLYAMGWETANIHLGAKKMIPAILKDLKKRPANWLRRASAEMADATVRDWEKWRRA